MIELGRVIITLGLVTVIGAAFAYVIIHFDDPRGRR